MRRLRAFILCLVLPTFGGGGVTSARVSAAPPVIAFLQRGDTIVKMATTPKHPGVASLVSEIAIGGAAATADEYIFTSVTDVFPLHDGSILVVDVGGGNLVFVRMYDARGKFVRTLGRRGEGPGEYLAPNGLAELPDGRIVLRDGRRLTLYTASGESRVLFSLTGSGGAVPPGVVVTTDGTIHMRIESLPAMGSRAAVAGGLVRLRADGTVIDTVAFPALPNPGLPFLVATRNRGASTGQVEVPYSPWAVWAFSPLGYFVTGLASRYAVEVRIPPARGGAGAGAMWKLGDPVVSIRRTIPLVAINDEERAERRKQAEEWLRIVDPAWQWTGPDVPRVKPPYTAIQIAADGRLWIQLSTPSEHFDPEPSRGVSSSGGRSGGGNVVARPQSTVIHWREPALYDVFEPDGGYVGQVAVPYDTTIYVMKGDLVWGSTRDADGAQTVRRFHIGWK